MLVNILRYSSKYHAVQTVAVLLPTFYFNSLHGGKIPQTKFYEQFIFISGGIHIEQINKHIVPCVWPVVEFSLLCRTNK